MKPFLSLIIPAYNEEDRIKKSLEEATEYLNQQNYSWEIIVIDDGSKDKTRDIVRNFDHNVILISLEKNSGKGAAVRRGMLECHGDVRIFTDADFSTPVIEIQKFIENFSIGVEICVGSRAIDPEMIKEHQPFYREWMGKTFNKIVRLLLVRGIKDTQCGFKGFTEKAALNVFSKALINGFSFDVEALYLAHIFGYKIKEIPVLWYNDTRSRVNPIKDSTRMFIELLRIRNLHKNTSK